MLFAALDAGRIPGRGPRRGRAAPPRGGPADAETAADTAELYGFAELQEPRAPGGGRAAPLLSVVPTTMWDESEAS